MTSTSTLSASDCVPTDAAALLIGRAWGPAEDGPSVNEVVTCDQAEPWSFGTGALMANRARRGLLTERGRPKMKLKSKEGRAMRWLKTAMTVFGAVMLLVPAISSAQDGAVKIGVLDDMSGPYSDNTGPGDLLAVRMAVADFGGSVLGKPIEVVSADMLNKVDVGVGIARRWYEQEQVDLIIGIPHSAIALGVVKLAEQANRLVMPTAAATAELTGKSCSAHSVHWVYDTYGQSKTLVNAILKQGGDSWFFITVDYAFGHALEQNASEFVKAAGGKVLGSARHPLNNPDFSSFLLQAQASKAKVVVMANGGADITNAIKQAKEFGLDRGGQRVAALLIQYPEVRAIGLPTAQGLLMASSFYWDMSPEARAFTDRFAAAKGMPPTMIQAGTYGATLHYLKAVKAAGTDEAKAVMAKMKEMPINDFMTRQGRIREDGRVIRDMYLMQVKTPDESKSEWDLAKIVATIPGDQAFRPLAEGGCPLVKK